VDLKNTPIAAASTRKKLKVYASELSVLADAFEKIGSRSAGSILGFLRPKGQEEAKSEALTLGRQESIDADV
jgi:hypothetical protein